MIRPFPPRFPLFWSLAIMIMSSGVHAQEPPIVLDVVVQDTSAFGTWVPFELTACNPSEADVELFLACPCCHEKLEIFDPEDERVAYLGGGTSGCIQAVVAERWAPFECKEWRHVWSQRRGAFFDYPLGAQVEPGSYRYEYEYRYLDNPYGQGKSLRAEGTLEIGEPGLCRPDATTLCLDDRPGDQRFSIRASFEDLDGAVDQAAAVPMQTVDARGGFFYFFDRSNPEILVKILDGCDVNGSFWAFGNATTTLGFEVVVEDLETGATWRYSNSVGNVALPVADVNAFPSCDP